jgi:2'-5' RNA ligase
MRLFLAIELPDSLRRSLYQLSTLLKRHDIPPKSFIRPENLHLTLKFLGEVVDPDVSRICEGLKQVPAPGLIRLVPDHIECLPERGPVRIISVGLGGELDRLQTLYNGIEDACERLGIRREGRRFRPHITLARLRRTLPPSARPLLDGISLPPSATAAFTVEEFVLMQSFLEPQGARYVVVARFPIGEMR